MIRIRQYGDRCNRVFTVKNPKKIPFWKALAKRETGIGLVVTELLWER